MTESRSSAVDLKPEAPSLYIFPHAGGSPSYYVPFSRAFSNGVRRIAVQYPGAQEGPSGPRVPSIHELADIIYRVLTRRAALNCPVAFFGHSMGALVAFEVIRRFESAGNLISALFVSGCSAPGHVKNEFFRDLSDDRVLKHVAELAGTNPKILDSKEFSDLFLPALRGYFGSIADYTCASGATVSCPIYAFVGTDDLLAPYENVSAWSDHTTSDFALRVFPGNHFYFSDHLLDVVGDVETRFQSLRGGRSG